MVQSNNIMILSLQERKSMRNRLTFNMYLFFSFIILPFHFVSEAFLFPYVRIITTDYPNSFSRIFSYLTQHFIWQNYIFTACLGFWGLFWILRPYRQYIIKGENLEEIQNKINNPTYIIVLFMFVFNISNLVNMIFDYRYIMSIPLPTLFYYTIFKNAWQMLLSVFTIFYFFSVNTPMRKTLSLYSFDISHLKIYAILKEYIVIACQLVIFMLIIVEAFNILDLFKTQYLGSQNIEKILSFSEVPFILNWGFGLLLCCTTLSTILLWIHQNIYTSVITQNTVDVKTLVNTGDLSSQTTYYEKDILGTFISEYNRLTDKMKNDIFKIRSATQTLNTENTKLRAQTSELIQAFNKQELNVSQMNTASNKISATLQHFLTELDKQSNILETEQENIDHLTSGTKNIVNSFDLIKKEYQLSRTSSKEAFGAVQNSVEKSIIMNNHIKDIHNKICTAGQETSAIDEVLNIIKNISEQTNLLSMSASIEAAHGDQSRKGFTLVSEEIRKLAQMSQESVGKISTRLSSITEYINDAYYISKDSLEASESSLKTGEQLKNSISQVIETSEDLSNTISQTDPITVEQEKIIGEFQEIITNMKDFLKNLMKEIRSESSTSVITSLYFRSVTQNFKTSKNILYNMESGLEKLKIIEDHLNYILKEFSFDENQ